jgi:dTMP kinase
MNRGKFILFEGLDRSGKTTQVDMLVSYLQSNNIKAISMKFPDRSTEIGKIIDSYLSNSTDLDDHVIHLLFAANRWELSKKLNEFLDKGINVICDRYSYSGMAYSSVDMEWTSNTEIGLPKPECVIFMDIKPSQIVNRDNFGEERYEQIEYQNKVYTNYMDIMTDDQIIWYILDATLTINTLHERIISIVEYYL